MKEKSPFEKKKGEVRAGFLASVFIQFSANRC